MPVDIVAEWRRGCWKISNRSIRCRTVSCSVCLAQNIPIARFFFFRTDSTRNILKPVVATLVHQLMNSIPELRPIIIQEIQTDPLIFTKSFKTQFQILIFGPLLQLQSESLTPSKTVVLLFDGVDECDKDDEQSKVIRVVTNFVRKHSFPMIAFFGSRAENHLCIEFRSPALSDNLLQLPLDTDYRADEDIRRFLLDSFTKIKATHPFGHDLRDSDWPAPEGLDDLVRKASGQFIYASVVLKFISTANQDPAQLLEIVRGLRPSGRLTPFAQLDALYRHIFSKVADIHVTSLVLAWKMFTVGASGASAYPYTQEVCGAMSQTEIKVALAALISVISFTDYNKMHFLHASLPDFLQDQKRSQVYYIDRATWSAQLSILTLRRIISNERSKLGGNGYPGKFASLFQSLYCLIPSRCLRFCCNGGITSGPRKSHRRIERAHCCTGVRSISAGLVPQKHR